MPLVPREGVIENGWAEDGRGKAQMIIRKSSRSRRETKQEEALGFMAFCLSASVPDWGGGVNCFFTDSRKNLLFNQNPITD